MKMDFLGHLLATYFLNALIPVQRSICSGTGLTSTKCFGELGCLNITPEWYGPRRRNPDPSDRESINTQFFLYMKNEEVHEITASRETIETSPFNLTKPTKIIIHGYMSSGLVEWIKDMANEILLEMEANVIAVDWQKGAKHPYPKSAVNTRVVALEIAYLLKTLKYALNYDISLVHLIGHSLGAHTAGYVGESFNGSLARITGLDPAAPFFNGMPSIVRLDQTDAQFVDVIHSDATGAKYLTIGINGFGMSEAIGHVDFYPNGGKQQPGCNFGTLVKENGLVEAGKDLQVCEHSRASEYFTETIRSSCSFMATECDDYQKFLKGECIDCGANNQHCIQMGFHADKLWKKNTSYKSFFLETGLSSPFCLYHYGLEIEVGKDLKNPTLGKLEIVLFGSIQETKLKILDTSAREFRKGKKVPFLGTSTSNVGEITGIELKWKCYRCSLRRIFFSKSSRSELHVARIHIASITQEQQLKKHAALCVDNESPYHVMKDGTSATFNKQC